MAATPYPRVVAIDLGTATVTAATLDPEGVVQPLLFPSGDNYPSMLPIGDDGIVHQPDWRGAATDVVTHTTRGLARPPQVIDGVPYSANTLIEMVTAPAVRAAEDSLGTSPDILAAVVPDHWPPRIVEAYVTALSAHQLPVMTVSPGEALVASLEENQLHHSVTFLDFGATTAGLTMVHGTRWNRRPDVSCRFVDPDGGERGIDRGVARKIASVADPSFNPSWGWLVDAELECARARQDAAGGGMLTIDLPDPIGPVAVEARKLLDLVEDLVVDVISKLIAREEVKDLWEADAERNPDRPEPTLRVTGGFSLDRSVSTAIRSAITGYEPLDHPAAAMAVGAALYAGASR